MPEPETEQSWDAPAEQHHDPMPRPQDEAGHDDSLQDGGGAEDTQRPVKTEPVTVDDIRSFESLTLTEALREFFRAPGATVQALRAVIATPRWEAEQHIPVAAPAVPLPQAAAPVLESDPVPAQSRADDSLWRREAVQLGLRLTALLLAWWGSGILANAAVRTEALALNAGAPYLLLAFFVWLGAEVYGDWPALRERWRGDSDTADAPDETPEGEKPVPARPVVWTGFHPVRVLLALAGLFFSIVALRFTSDNQFTFIGFWSWLLSVALWVGAFAPSGWSIRPAWHWLRARWAVGWRGNWSLWVLLLILALGATLRFADLPGVPPEMTSDHVEKILDAARVRNGQHQVFFANNGGREPFQMYAMALFAQLPGQGFNATSLKLLSALEGMLAIVVMYWLGRTALNREDPRLANLVGLLLAALVAVSYWHVALSRLGLRIILTTVITGLLLIFMARALRDNRRGDYILAGLTLGFGLYTYQAVRMLPVLILAGVALAIVFKARSLKTFGRYLFNLTVLVVVAFVAFVPLFGYSLQYPQDFWRRTSGRLLGDDTIQETQPDGTIVQRDVTLQERLEAFNANLPILTDNLRNALLMFNWKGDVAWINAAPNRPAMDVFTGALFICGLAAWLARMIRRRDVFDWLVPLALVIMLLPSALSIAYPVENPSHTRTSGALPEAYLIAALPLALVVASILRLARGRAGVLLSGGLVALIVLGAHNLNSNIYFNDYRESYLVSSLPYTEAGRILRGFAQSDGSYGNAFMIAYPYWWDHRAIGIEGGRTDWPNGIISRNDIASFLGEAAQRDDEYRLNPERDLLFFYATEDDETELLLMELFPEGYAQFRQSYQEDDDYKLFRVPRLGAEGFSAFLDEHTAG